MKVRRGKRGDLAGEAKSGRSQSPHGTEVPRWTPKVHAVETLRHTRSWGASLTRGDLAGDGKPGQHNPGGGTGGRKVDSESATTDS